jgi:hypothetical protein
MMGMQARVERWPDVQRTPEVEEESARPARPRR